MRLKTHVMTFAAIAGVISASLILPDSPVSAKGKPGSGGGETIDLGNFTFAFEDSGAIYVTTIDDGNRVKLTNPKGGEHGSPTWSPDLSPDPEYQGLIAYLDFRSDRRVVIVTDGNQNWLVRSFTADDLLPSELGADVTLAWTPNGQELVYVSRSNRIVALDVATGSTRVILDFSSDLGPDTQDVTIAPGMLAYVRREDIWVADFQLNEFGRIVVDEASIRNLTNTPNILKLACSLSRDGSYLSYSEYPDQPGVRWQIVVRDLDTMQEIVVMDGLGGRREVAWSPDSTELAIYNLGASSKSGQSVIDLFRITNWADPVNRAVIQVTNTAGSDELYPDWRPGALEF